MRDEQFVLISRTQLCAAGDDGKWCTESGEIRWCQAMQALVRCQAEFKRDMLWVGEPVKHVMDC